MIAYFSAEIDDMAFRASSFSADGDRPARVLVAVGHSSVANMRIDWFCSAEAARAFAAILTKAADKLDAAQAEQVPA